MDVDVVAASVVDPDLSDHACQIIELVVPELKGCYDSGVKVCRPITQMGLFHFFGIVESASFDFVNESERDVDEKFTVFMNILEQAFLTAFPEKISRALWHGSIMN